MATITERVTVPFDQYIDLAQGDPNVVVFANSGSMGLRFHCSMEIPDTETDAYFYLKPPESQGRVASKSIIAVSDYSALLCCRAEVEATDVIVVRGDSKVTPVGEATPLPARS